VGVSSFDSRTGWTPHHEATYLVAFYLVRSTEHHETDPENHANLNHTIFEGTSEIQQLVIARAISGLSIE
jgi:alkylation response protein AidB-like acyl-CoA dehydrogenase